MGSLIASERLIKLLAKVESTYCEAVNGKDPSVRAFLMPDKIVIGLFSPDPRNKIIPDGNSTVFKIIHFDEGDLIADRDFEVIELTPRSYSHETYDFFGNLEKTKPKTPFKIMADNLAKFRLRTGQSIKINYDGNALSTVSFHSSSSLGAISITPPKFKDPRKVLNLVKWLSKSCKGTLYEGGYDDVDFLKGFLKLKNRQVASLYKSKLKKLALERGANLGAFVSTRIKTKPNADIKDRFKTIELQTDDNDTGLKISDAQVSAFIPIKELPPTNQQYKFKVGNEFSAWIPSAATVSYGNFDEPHNWFFIGFNGWVGEFPALMFLVDLVNSEKDNEKR